MNYTRDEEVWSHVKKEEQRQKEALNLIASENIAPQEIQNLMASCLSNKYAEGYPGRRYYSGCQFVDEVEKIAIERAKELFRSRTCKRTTTCWFTSKHGRLSRNFKTR